MDIDDKKRKAIRMILSGQDELPVTLETDPLPEDFDSHHGEGYNESKGSNMTQEHTHEDTTDYKEMAAFFQTRIGEIQKSHEADLYFLQKEIARLQKQLEEGKSLVVD